MSRCNNNCRRVLVPLVRFPLVGGPCILLLQFCLFVSFLFCEEFHVVYGQEVVEDDGSPPDIPVEAEEEPPTPPPPPPPPPPPKEPEPEPERIVQDTTPTETTSTEPSNIRHRRLMEEKIEKNEHLKRDGHHWMPGSWLYGDLHTHRVHDDHPYTAHGCADICEKEPECYHWVFTLDSGRCDLKVNHGGHNNDAVHMITGHAKRYLKFVEDKEKSEMRNQASPEL